VVIFADGSAIFDGRSYVRKPGLTKTTVRLELVGQLLGEADALRFFEGPPSIGYDEPGAGGCASIQSDAPEVIVSVISGGKSKTVRHHHRCTGIESERLTQFEDSIDRAIDSKKWR